MIGELSAILAGGFLGSAHCIGMCGGFAAAIGAADIPFWPIFARQLVYNVGRVFTYAFLGCLAGAGGGYLSTIQLGPLNIQQAFSILAGTIMLIVGLSALRVVRLPASWLRYTTGLFSPLFAHLLNARGWSGYFTAGIANGFLPCGLVYSFVALAAAKSDPLHGMILMIAFGFGTLPAMMLIGCGASVMTHATRVKVYRVAAVFVIGLGLITVWRGWPREEPCCHDEPALSLRVSPPP
ncbi:MAG: sulfite exporter TauE/SafE family protein [Planctomycetota bacterium]